MPPGRAWTEQLIRRELEAFLPGWDAWPSYGDFRRSGRRGLWQAMTRYGGPRRFAEEYGLPYAPDRRQFTDAEIRVRLRAAFRGSDLSAWPPRAWLVAHVGHEVVAAIDRTGGPRRWARELGIPFRHRRRHRWQPDAIAAALEPLLAGRHTWPSRREFETAGLAGLYAAITHTEGHAALAARYGLALQRPTRARAAPRHSSSAAEDPRTPRR